jgi:hypothetical protein
MPPLKLHTTAEVLVVDSGDELLLLLLLLLSSAAAAAAAPEESLSPEVSHALTKMLWDRKLELRESFNAVSTACASWGDEEEEEEDDADDFKQNFEYLG